MVTASGLVVPIHWGNPARPDGPVSCSETARVAPGARSSSMIRGTRVFLNRSMNSGISLSSDGVWGRWAPASATSQSFGKLPIAARSSVMERWDISLTCTDCATGRTETLTVATELLCPLLTVSSNLKVVPFAGTVKVTFGALVLVSDTGVPRVSFHEKLIAFHLGASL